MGKKIRALGIILIMLASGFGLSFADMDEIIELNTLINDSKQYDNKTVVVEGEALLEALERGDFAWVNINDGTNAIGVYMPIEMIKQIHRYGDYKNYGDMLKMKVIMHRACKEHGGDLDLHLISLISVTPGSVKENPITSQRLMLAMVSSLTMVLAAGFYWRKRLKVIRKRRTQAQKVN